MIASPFIEASTLPRMKLAPVAAPFPATGGKSEAAKFLWPLINHNLKNYVAPLYSSSPIVPENISVARLSPSISFPFLPQIGVTIRFLLFVMNLPIPIHLIMWLARYFSAFQTKAKATHLLDRHVRFAPVTANG